jgi:D-glycero-alpha-D-manno-heptose-7-phosphate kinase
MTRVRAWCRVDFAGGTLDIWPLGLLHRGARTVNVAIDLAVEVGLEARTGGYEVQLAGHELRFASIAELIVDARTALLGTIAEYFELPPVRIEVASASPQGGGLGASSAMAVAMIAAVEEEFALPISAPAERARLARDLEARLMQLPTGIQDHYPAQLGGALEIMLLPGGEQVRRLAVDLDALASSLLVVDSGRSHFSAGQNWGILRRRFDGDPEIPRLLGAIAGVAGEMASALEAGNLARAGALLSDEWSVRRQLASGIAVPQTDALLDLGQRHGAWGGKVCGAGGGGCVVLLCPPERRTALRQAVSEFGAVALDTQPTDLPLRVVR